MSGLDLVFLGLLILLLLPVVVIDLRERRIPNLWNLLIALAGLAHVLAVEFTWRRLGLAFGHAGLTLILLLSMSWLIGRVNARAVIGFGDIKFLVAASFWLGFTGALLVLLAASLLTLLLALLGALAGRGAGWREQRPFGPALALALLLLTALAFSPWSQRLGPPGGQQTELAAD